MGIKLERLDIVILASAHNPSIMSPEWIKGNDLISENPKNFIHTPDFSLFESESYTLVLDRQRFQIMSTAAMQDENTVKSIAKIASSYIAILPEVPYTALGLNLSFSLASDDEIKVPEIGFTLNPTKDWRNLLEGHDLAYGGIVYARKETYMLSLTITPVDENDLVYKFNYHYDIIGEDADKIQSYISIFSKLYVQSLNVVESTAK